MRTALKNLKAHLVNSLNKITNKTFIMAIEKHSIGGTMVPQEGFETFADISPNRIFLTQKFTVNPPVKPHIAHGLTNTEQVFEEFKPVVDVEFVTEEGGVRKETLHFKNVSDFGLTGITKQSKLLNQLTLQKQGYQKITGQLKTNKTLKLALADEVSKENLILSLRALIQQLKDAE